MRKKASLLEKEEFYSALFVIFFMITFMIDLNIYKTQINYSIFHGVISGLTSILIMRLIKWANKRGIV